jgi:hypothetical protein
LFVSTFIAFRLEQPVNTPLPRLVTLLGILMPPPTTPRPTQYANALSPRLVTLLGRLTSVRTAQP